MRRVLAALATTEPVALARRFLWSGLGFLALGGLMALIIRWQWAFPGQPVPLVGAWLYPESGGVVTAAAYTGLFTSHGLVMIFFAITPILIGCLSNLLVPRAIGARQMALPRLGAAAFWVLALAQLTALVALALPDVGPAAGWTQYAPLSSSSATPGPGQSVMLAALALAGLSTVLGAINVVVTVLVARAPGVGLGELPLAIWGLFLTAVLNALYVPILIVALGGVLLDREAGTQFFSGDGAPLLYQHLFWLFGHPEVYILVLPVWGLVGDVLARDAGKPPHFYRGTVGAFIAVSAMAGLVYGHHMFQAGIGAGWGGAFEVFTLLISGPGTLVFVNWMLTLWRGAIRLTVPMLFALGTLVVFALGGLSGLFLGAVTTDILLHDTMWVVGHFHLIMAAAALLGGFAAIYDGFPTLFGRALDARLGVIHFAGTLVFALATFGGQLVVGLGGQLRRLYDPAQYQTFAHLQGWNRWTSYAAFALGAVQLVFVWNLVATLRRPRGAPVDAPVAGPSAPVALAGPVAVVVAIAASAILFTALGLTYVAARVRTGAPAGVVLPAGLGLGALGLAAAAALGASLARRDRLAAVLVAASAALDLGLLAGVGGGAIDATADPASAALVALVGLHGGVGAITALGLGWASRRPCAPLWRSYLWAHVGIGAALAGLYAVTR